MIPITARRVGELLSRLWLSVVVFALTINLIPATADTAKQPWLANCPQVVDLTPNLPVPTTKNLMFQNSGQLFTKVKKPVPLN